MCVLCCLFVINPTVFLDTSKYVKTKPMYNILFITSALCAFWRRLHNQSFVNFPCQWIIHKLLVRKLGTKILGHLVDDLITLLEDNLIDHVDCDL